MLLSQSRIGLPQFEQKFGVPTEGLPQLAQREDVCSTDAFLFSDSAKRKRAGPAMMSHVKIDQNTPPNTPRCAPNSCGRIEITTTPTKETIMIVRMIFHCSFDKLICNPWVLVRVLPPTSHPASIVCIRARLSALLHHGQCGDAHVQAGFTMRYQDLGHLSHGLRNEVQEAAAEGRPRYAARAGATPGSITLHDEEATSTAFRASRHEVIELSRALLTAGAGVVMASL